MRKITCLSGKALHVQAEDGYHSYFDTSHGIAGLILNKLKQRQVAI